MYSAFFWLKKKRKSMIECHPITSQKRKQTQKVEGTCSCPHTTTILEVRLLGSRSVGPDLTP